MKEFKFFQKGTLNDPQMLDETTRATASFNADTPEGYMSRRMLYHTQLDVYGRFRNPSNNGPARPTLNQEEVVRRINEGQPTGVIHNDNHGNTDYIPFFTGGPRKTTVNPNWITKIKMVLQESWTYDPIGVVFVSILATIVTIIGIAKVLNIW